ncbi:MAG: hypothetical protein QUS14_09860, partial [Pyrinomonadaceae bacterium]|nr:hypothetical protein [Pyrinomonadaceae bacterium]
TRYTALSRGLGDVYKRQEFMGITAKEVDMRKPVTRSETLVEEEDEDTYFAVSEEPATRPQAHNELEEFLL